MNRLDYPKSVLAIHTEKNVTWWLLTIVYCELPYSLPIWACGAVHWYASKAARRFRPGLVRMPGRVTVSHFNGI